MEHSVRLWGNGTYTSKPNCCATNNSNTILINLKHTHNCFDSTNETDSITFRLTPKPNIQDLQVSIVPITIARPGFNSSYKIIAKNVGTKMMYLPMVKFIKDFANIYGFNNVCF
ncbi:MAG: hypothetical protein IPL21_14315 [Saprospirales bacterium]|nr:hypothetical protein [Saprospirales bacterium]